MATICLCMIVRDERTVIERCLASVRGLIDYWVVCDTGSSDGTQTAVVEALAGVPGELHERGWTDFGHNRTELMALARGKADYLLLIDADMTVELCNGLPPLTADSYLLRHAEDPEYWIKRLVRGDREWRYLGSTHEYLISDGTDRELRLHELVIHHHADSGTRAEKFHRDLNLLTKELDRDQDNPRAVFYLAQTHRDLGDLGPALGLYRRRAAMGGWDEEVYYSLLQVGVLEAERGDWPAGMSHLVAALEYRPSRLEALYELASRLRVRREYHAAYMFAAHGVNRRQPDDILFVAQWMGRWGLLFEYSISAYWVGRSHEALGACNRLLRMPDLPEAYRAQTVANREYCLERLRSDVRVPGSRVSATRGARPHRAV